jgi:isoaspartyl peptidase/L-asparaginase-like protein (Ntn-hydrolase superfamily)
VARILVGDGARSFATSLGPNSTRGPVETVDPTTMITPQTQQQWQRWRSRLIATSFPGALRNEIAGDLETLNDVQDTVGAVSVSQSGYISAGVSRYRNPRICLGRAVDIHHSGGLLLKLAGRVGEVRCA